MHLTYQGLSKRPLSFIRMTGLTIQEFKELVNKIAPSYQQIEESKLCHGRNSRLVTLEDKLLCVLIYYRTYITHVFLGYLFNLDASNICRLLKKLEPFLAKKITITKDRSLTPQAVVKVLADVREQATQRPTKKQKKSYSGKKKRHTIKTEIILEEQGKLISVSRSHRGSTHDFRIRKQEKPLARERIKIADAGYQGWQKIQSNVVLPYKRSKKRPLTKQQKEHNNKLSSFRMRIEHKIREIKIFKIMSEVYRNFQKKYNLRFNMIAGLVNFKHAF